MEYWENDESQRSQSTKREIKRVIWNEDDSLEGFDKLW